MRTRPRIKLESDEELTRILELEDRVSKSGPEIETGFLIEEGIREWDFEAGPKETEEVLQILKSAGFKAKKVTLRDPRERRGKYREGDVFRVPLSDGRFAYGRVLIIKPSKHVFVQIYRGAWPGDLPVAELARSDWLVKVYCLDNGISGGKWKIVGNLPPRTPPEMPLFWTDNLFDGKFYLRKDPVSSIGQRETTPEEIVKLRAQPAVLVVPESVEIVLNQVLVDGRAHEWFQPELSKNPLRRQRTAP